MRLHGNSRSLILFFFIHSMATPLGSALVQKETSKNYQTAIQKFSRWCEGVGGSFDDIVGRRRRMDKMLSKYFHYLYDHGYGVSAASVLLSAVLHFYPSFKWRLPISFQAWRGWLKLEPSIHKPAISWQLTVVVAAVLARDFNFQFALIVLLSFDCYLRPNEALNLCFDDIIFSSIPIAIPSSTNDFSIVGDSHPRIGIRIKIGKRDRNAVVVIQNPLIAKLVSKYFQKSLKGKGGKVSSDRLFSVNYSSTLKAFKSTIALLGLPKNILLHSLRHSGVTNDFLNGVEFARLRERGRWKNDKTLRSYLNIAVALLNDLRAPPSFNDFGSLLSPHLDFYFSSLYL